MILWSWSAREQQQLNHAVVNWQTHRAGPIKPDHLTITHCKLLNCLWKHQHMNYSLGASWNEFLWLSNNWRSGHVMNNASLSGSLMVLGLADTKFTLPARMNTSYIRGWMDNCVGLFVRAYNQILQDTSMIRLPETFHGCSKCLWFHQARQRSRHQECGRLSSGRKLWQCIEQLVDFQSKTPDSTTQAKNYFKTYK